MVKTTSEEDEKSRLTSDTPQSVYDDKFDDMVSSVQIGGDPVKKKRLSPEELASKETSGDGSTHKGDASSEREKSTVASATDQLGKGFTGDVAQGIAKSTGMAGLITRKRAAGGGGIIGAIVTLAFIIFFTSSGPFQFVHIAQLLQKFHFTNQEDAADDRMSKIGRYIRHRNKPENVRLGLLGNRYADAIEKKLNKSGIESQYTEKRGYLDGYIVDPAAIADDSDLADLKNKSPEEIQKHFKDKFNVDLTIDATTGTLKADADGMGYFKQRGLVKNMLEAGGYGKITGAMRTRIMGKRAAIDWHPMKKVDRKILSAFDARFAKWKTDRKKRIYEGVDNNINGTSDEKARTDDQEPTEETKGAKAETDEALNLGNDAGEEIRTNTEGGGVDALTKHVDLKLTGKIVGGASAAIGIACAVKGIADNIDAVKHANVVLPLMRMGMEMVTVGNQVMDGKDADTEQLGFYAKQLSSEDKGSWANARSIQAENGEAQTGPDIKGEAQIQNEKNVVSEFVGSIPAIGTVCKAANSGLGQAASFGVDFIGGPVSAVFGQAFSILIEKAGVIEGIVGWIAGSPIRTTVVGADFGNYINYGARLASNDSSIAGGGRKLSGTETLALKSQRLKYEQEEIKHKSIADRYLNPYDNSSLLGRIIDKQNPTFSGNMQNLAQLPTSLFRSIIKLSSTLLNPPRVLATTPYVYGFPEYGFSGDELNSNFVKNPFQNAEEVQTILNGPDGGELKDRASKCFGVTFDSSNNVSDRGKTSPYYEIPDSCASGSTDWLRIRFYILDTQVMDSAACFEGDSDACASVGFGNKAAANASSQTPAGAQIVGDPYSSSESVACATGTKDLGVQDAYSNKVVVKMRFCALLNLKSSSEESTPGSSYYVEGSDGHGIVNSRVSGAWFALVSAAQAAGNNLAANSTYRTLAHQQALFSQNPNPAAVAPPGSSPHQAGVAIDFTGMGPYSASSGASCANRQKRPGNANWEWLFANANKFGFKQYAAEAWHWDASPDSNRC